jgi:hypothetical protein
MIPLKATLDTFVIRILSKSLNLSFKVFCLLLLYSSSSLCYVLFATFLFPIIGAPSVEKDM